MVAAESSVEAIAAALASDDPRTVLEAQRADLARRIPAAADRDAAALHLRLADVIDRLAALPALSGGTALDELAHRRKAAGRPDASGGARAAGDTKRR